LIGDIVIANVLASACLVLLIYFFDINEKEPPWTLVRIFIFSILMTFLFGKLKGLLFERFEWEFSILFSNYVIAGFFEELLKFLVVLIFVWPLKSFNEETDGIIYYLVVAAGFAVLENVGYSFQFVISPYVYGLQTGQMGVYRDALQKIVLFRAVSGHIFINVVSGFFLGLAKRKHRWWLLIPGFIVSVLLHGTWNQTATMGFLGYYVLAFLLLDVALFLWTVRMSFYFKFMKRLKFRVKELIREAKEGGLDKDIVTLMEGIKANVGTLRQMEGDVLTNQAKEITQTLPPRVDAVPRGGENGLIERLLKVNGLLSRDRQKSGKWFWMGLFMMFSVSGFFVLLILMNLM
jgi:RsiW-degrading membrane proteinase PrsW (M82 family)